MEVKKTLTQRRKYDANFKAEVIKMALNGRPTLEIAHSMGISEAIIYKWKRAHPSYLPASGDPESLSPSGEITVIEYERLRSRLREVEQERDILKKALGIFSRGG